MTFEKINRDIYNSYDLNGQAQFWLDMREAGYENAGSITWYEQRLTDIQRALWWEYYERDYVAPDGLGAIGSMYNGDPLGEIMNPPPVGGPPVGGEGDEDFSIGDFDMGDEEIEFSEDDEDMKEEEEEGGVGSVGNGMPFNITDPDNAFTVPLPEVGLYDGRPPSCYDRCKEEDIKGRKVCTVIRQRVAEWLKDNGCPSVIRAAKTGRRRCGATRTTTCSCCH